MLTDEEIEFCVMIPEDVAKLKDQAREANRLRELIRRFMAARAVGEFDAMCEEAEAALGEACQQS
jgi:hypothetical protein